MQLGDLASLEDRFLEGLDKARSHWITWRRRRAMPKAKQAQVLEAMSRPLSVGKPMVEVAHFFAEHGSSVQRELGQSIKEAKQSGAPASEAFALWLDPVSASALRSAETGGARTLARAMGLLADEMLRETAGLSSVVKKWLHPGVYVLITSILIVVMAVKVAPLIASIQSGDSDEIAMLLSMANFYTGAFWLCLLALMAIALCIVYYLRNGIGDFRDQLDRTGITAGYRRKLGASLLRSFALLKQIGVPAHRIFKSLSQSGSRYYRWHLHRMRDRLSEGQAQDVFALDTGLFDSEQMALITLYASGSSREELSEALMKAADDIAKRSVEKLKIIGVVVAGLLWAWLVYNLIVLISFLFSTQA